MGSDPNDASTSGTANDAKRKLPGPRAETALVKAVQDKLRCSPAQAKLSLDAVLAAIREFPKPLRILGFGVFETDGKRISLRGFKSG